ncbi:MAG: hypothetical protein CMO55_11495 [Verrucomicrobiales bacterium]|nr:hypothetical protein [Verrucomicrobiales bacterium]
MSSFPSSDEVPPSHSESTRTNVSRESFAAKPQRGKKFVCFLMTLGLLVASAAGGWMTIKYFLSTPSVSGVIEPPAQPFNQNPISPATGQSTSLQGEPPSSPKAQSVPQQDPAEPLNPPVPVETKAPEPPVSAATTDEPEEDPNGLWELREQLSVSSSPTEGMYLNAVRTHEQAGKLAQALQITRDGREVFPDSDSLLLSESDLLAATGSPDEAWELLARTGRVGDRQFASRILRYGVDAEKYDETLVVLSSGGSHQYDWSQEDWVALVKLYENTGQIELALQTAKKHLVDEAEIKRLKSILENAPKPDPNAG